MFVSCGGVVAFARAFSWTAVSGVDAQWENNRAAGFCCDRKRVHVPPASGVDQRGRSGSGLIRRRNRQSCPVQRRRRGLLRMQGVGAVQAEKMDNARGKKCVFVTGATGFIGLNLCRRLVLGPNSGSGDSPAQGDRVDYEVHVLVRRVPVQGELAKLADASSSSSLVVHQGDVTDLASIEAALQAASVTEWACVFHVAGMIAYSAKFRAQMEAINVEGTRNVCTAMRTHAPHARLVYVSSVTAVGANKRPSDPPLNEDAPWDQALGDSVGYMYTKRLAEQVVVSEFSELNSVVLCPSNVYGAGDASKSSRKTQLKAARGEWPLYTNGGVSLVDIQAMVEVLITCMDPHRGRQGERYIISGDNVRIYDMLRMYSECGTGSKQKAPWLLLPNWALWLLCLLGEKTGSSSFTLERATVSTLYHWFDNAKAKAELGLRVKPAHECIQESVNWMRETGLLDK
ncbi:putative dihydroflavonol 4-reductase [Porphyridium purpureum]|uniref:Putative dihydroflavonol 4-reductase n=1 Tax=Porphyridium purpureum TaxID=35688 RepID=A0A5J4YL48_PORPP|nr:putative dihydroflavonol 4-reductase [Porphyridium purpureum]|eukprot:POR8599..scf246_12